MLKDHIELWYIRCSFLQVGCLLIQLATLNMIEFMLRCFKNLVYLMIPVWWSTFGPDLKVQMLQELIYSWLWPPSQMWYLTWFTSYESLQYEHEMSSNFITKHKLYIRRTKTPRASQLKYNWTLWVFLKLFYYSTHTLYSIYTFFYPAQYSFNC